MPGVILNSGDTGATRLKLMADLFMADKKTASYIRLMKRAGLIDCRVETFQKVTQAGQE